MPFEGLTVGLLIQAVGLSAYFIGKSLSQEKAHFSVYFLNIILILYLPLSSIIEFVCNGVIMPYPTNSVSSILFILIYAVLVFVVYFSLQNMNKHS